MLLSVSHIKAIGGSHPVIISKGLRTKEKTKDKKNEPFSMVSANEQLFQHTDILLSYISVHHIQQDSCSPTESA